MELQELQYAILKDLEVEIVNEEKGKSCTLIFMSEGVNISEHIYNVIKHYPVTSIKYFFNKKNKTIKYTKVNDVEFSIVSRQIFDTIDFVLEENLNKIDIKNILKVKILC